MRHSLFYPCIFGFITGILIHSFCDVSFIILFWSALVSVSLLCYTFHLHAVHDAKSVQQYSWFFIGVIFLFSCSLGMLRYHTFLSHLNTNDLEEKVGQTVSLQGIVREEPTQKETSTQLIVDYHGTSILVTDDLYSHVQYGDLIEISGELKKPENFVTDQGRTFDYVSYLMKDHIVYVVRARDVTLIAHGHGSIIKRFIFSMKQHFIDALNQTLPFPESRLAAGLVVAGKQALPKNIQQEFIDTGTIQVVVLSGYNVTLIAETLLLLLSSLPKVWSIVCGGVFVAVFTIAAGGSATVVRAAVMVLIALSGKMLRRKYQVGRALLVTAVGMLIVNPMLLVFDPSFQLSFLATFGLIYCTPYVEHYVAFIPEKYNFRNVIASTTATQIFVTPFLLYLSGKISLIALPANFLLFFITPLTMLLSFTTGVLGIFLKNFIIPLRFAAFMLLHAMLGIVHVFSRIPFASLPVPFFPWWCVALVYMCYAVSMWRFKNIKNKKAPLSGLREGTSDTSLQL